MKRKQNGQGMIEGTVGLMLVMGGGVAATLLVLNMAAIGYFQNKLNFVTEKAAAYAAANIGLTTEIADTTTLARSLMQQSGMPNSTSAMITITNITISPVPTSPDADAVSVRISCQFPLFGGGSVVPSTITLTDLVVAPQPRS